MLRTPKQPAGMAGRTAAIPRDVTEWNRSSIAGGCLSAEFTGYEGMGGTKSTQEKMDSLRSLGDNIKVTTINHIGFYLFW